MAKHRVSKADDWRRFLTPEEAAFVAKADEAREAWQGLKARRSRIISRACRLRDEENETG